MSTKYELPKTKAPFAKFLATLPPNQYIAITSCKNCAIAQFLKQRTGGNKEVTVGGWEYSFKHADYPFPEWAKTFSNKMFELRTKMNEDVQYYDRWKEPTVKQLLKVLETV